jgi:integrase
LLSSKVDACPCDRAGVIDTTYPIEQEVNAMTVQATESRLKIKPAKPYADFPLFPHATRRWAKKIKGRLCYFGPWDDPDAALNKYLEQREALFAGRKPQPKSDGLALRELVNRFLTFKRHLLDTSELSPRTWQEQYATCERLIEAFGRERPVLDLSPADFEGLRGSFSKTLGVVALGNAVQRVRSVFKYAYDSGLIDTPIRFGPGFKKPSRKALRLSRAAKQNANGLRMIEAAELRKIVAAAKVPMKAMVLLAINAGFGQSDVACLPMNALDLKAGWLNFPRPKTGVPRRVPLWPETIAALKDVLAERPKAREKQDEGLVFLTQRGARWVRVTSKHTPDDVCGQEFAKLATEVSVKRAGLSFYAIRHSFQTVAETSRDLPAVASIMGHVDSSMAGLYRETIDDGRLLTVTQHVRTWLFGKDKKPQA